VHMNLIESITPVSETIKSTIYGVDSILEILKKWRSYRISDLTTLKMLYLELDRYMELIEVMKLKVFTKTAILSTAAISLIKNINLTVTGLVLAKEEKYSVFKKMMKRGILRWRGRHERRRDYGNVLQALSFIYTKTGILKQLADTGDKTLLKEIKLKERLQNIEESINIVLKVLVTFKEVNVIARRWHH